MDFHKVFAFLDERLTNGNRCVLVTVGGVDGSSMRNPGTIMGVAEDGRYIGSLSGGCIENAVVAEALDVQKAGEPRVVRFGAGSPYMDIKLPCGGGLDLHFLPLFDGQLPRQCLTSISRREPFSLELLGNVARHISGWKRTQFDPATMTGVFGYWPLPRLLIIGHGAGIEALARLALSMDCEVEVLTPDERIERVLEIDRVSVQRLERTSQTELLKSDPWTAVVFLFHDHDWEIELLRAALSQPHFYIGAMGGKRAHANRRHALAEAGVSERSIETIHAPIGLFHSSRDPQTLALSALGEIIRAYQRADFERTIG